MLYVYRFLRPLRLGGCWFVVYIRRFIYKFFNVCPFDYTAVAWSEKVGPVNQVSHTCWVAVVTPTDRPKSVRNRCVINLFCGVVCVVTLPFWHFCWCMGFCHRTESDLFLFSSPEPKAQVSYCHRAPSVVRPSVRRRPSSVCPSVNFHIFNYFFRTAWWILIKFGRDEVLMVPYKCCCFSARSAQGRIQGVAKIGHGGPLLQETSSKATATNQLDSNDLEACGKKCCYFWFHSEVKFLTRFDVFLDLVIFAYFNAIFIDFYAIKSFVCIYFV